MLPVTESKVETYRLDRHHVDSVLSILEEVCSLPEVMDALAKGAPFKAIALMGHLSQLDRAVKKQREL
jgi:hypothetical protein